MQQVLDLLESGLWVSGLKISEATNLSKRSLRPILNAMEKNQIIAGRGGFGTNWLYLRHYRIDWPKDAT